jgi:glutamine synthetase
LNCLKRSSRHTFSPTNISWGHEDRTSFLRIKRGATASRHIENRAPTALSNPYLVGAALLAAGLNGIEEELDLEPAAHAPAEEDPSKEPLPTSAREGLDARNRPKARRRARRRLRNRVHHDAQARAATIRRPRHRLGTAGVRRGLLRRYGP